MKKFTKVVAVLLAIVLLGSLAACGQGNTAVQESSTVSETSAAQSAQESTQAAKEPITINAHIGNFNGSGGVLDDSIFNDLIKEKFGITINFIQAGDQNKNKLAAMMATGDLPDFIEVGDSATLSNLIKGDFLAPLNDLVEKNGADITKNAPVMVQFMKDSFGNSDKLYALAKGVGPDVPVGYWHVGFYGMWDVFKKAGGQMPDNMDGLLDLFKKMQDLYPKNEKGQKVYALSIWKDWDNNVLSFINYGLSDLYGKHISDSNGSLLFTEYDTATSQQSELLSPDSFYFKALKWLNKANKMGILDPDSITQKFDTALSKVSDGRRLFTYWQWESGSWNNGEAVTKDSMRGMMPIYPKDAVMTVNPDAKTGGQQYYAISAKSKYADRITELLNYMYTIEGSAQFSNGIEGKDWVITNGKAQYTEENRAAIKAGKSHMTVNNPSSWFSALSEKTIDPRTGERITPLSWSEEVKLNLTDREKDFSTAFGGVLNPEEYIRKNLKVVQKTDFKGYTTAAPDDIKVIQAKMSDVTKANSWRMIFAKDDAQFEQLKNDMISKCKSLGSEKEFEWEKVEMAAALAKAEKYK